MTDLSRLILGTAPDSWGVWFPEDPHQVTWRQYLDELPKAGYYWTELGPQGFLPQDPAQLGDELARRGLQVCGGTVFAGLRTAGASNATDTARINSKPSFFVQPAQPAVNGLLFATTRAIPALREPEICIWPIPPAQTWRHFS